MAKMDGADGVAVEDKGQLNYHVILIGQSSAPSVAPDLKH